MMYLGAPDGLDAAWVSGIGKLHMLVKIVNTLTWVARTSVLVTTHIAIPSTCS